MSLVFLNGRYLPSDEAVVPVTDRGFLFGDGIYETLQAFRGRIRATDHHLRRLRKSASILEIPLPYSDDEWNAILCEMLRQNECERAILRITISAGPSSGLGRSRLVTAPTIVVSCEPAPVYSEEDYSRGISVIVAQSVHHPGPQPWVEAKTANRLVFILAAQEAARQGADDAILTDAEGNLVEGTRGNLFVVQAGALRTPPLDSGCLDGVTRRLVMEAACEIGVSVTESALPIEDLLAADEAFQTFTSAGIMPVTGAERTQISGGAAGALTRRLLATYRELNAV